MRPNVMPKAPAPPMTEQQTSDPVARVAVEASVSAEVVEPVLVAWQAIREAIGRVQCSTPDQISDAMALLVSARRDMDAVVQDLIAVGFRR